MPAARAQSSPISPRRRARRSLARGITLVEALLVVGILALMSGAAIVGLGQAPAAKLRRSAIMIASAVRVAFAHSSATSNCVRLEFDFDQRLVSLQESTQTLLVKQNDRTGGAAAATQAERDALEQADKILKGPTAPRPLFKATKAFGFDPEKGKTGRLLGDGIRIVQIEVSHDELPETDQQKGQRAYLYFWPGGQTERAAIQLSTTVSTAPATDLDSITVLVSPLTGKAELKKGRFAMPRPRDEREESERADGF